MTLERLATIVDFDGFKVDSRNRITLGVNMRFYAVAAVLMFAGLGLSAKADVLNPNFAATIPSPGYGPVPNWAETNAAQGSQPASTAPSNYFWNNGTLPAGDSTVGFIQEQGTFSQTLSLVPGQQYTLSFVDNSRSGFTAPTLVVSVGGTTLLDQAVTAVGGTNPFYTESFMFTAMTGSEDLDFTNSDPTGADATVLLSDVHVTAVSAVPEPSSLMLLGTGILGAAGMVRRRFVRS